MPTMEIWEYLAYASLVAAAIVIALVAHVIVYHILGRLREGVEGSLVRRSRRPVRLLVVFTAVLLVLPIIDFPVEVEAVLLRALGLAISAVFGWLAVSFIGVIEDLALIRFPVDVADNLEARAMHTRMHVVKNVATVVITTITAAIILMSFPSVRQLGVSMLASAGIIALVAGMAARPTLANLIAGFQIALTQPIRLDDVVVIEGEWGKIEEITSSFVVVRIWDSRRLVLPLSYFVEHPIENWTRHSSEILGTVFIYMDYTIPVESVRQELHSILRATDLWDGNVWNLQVTDAKEQTLELRALMSSRDASEGWDLRCHVREKLVEFLQREHDASLPRLRADVADGTLQDGRRAKQELPGVTDPK